MSSYGPQGGPYPGQPQDPWQDGSADDPYHSGYASDPSLGETTRRAPGQYGADQSGTGQYGASQSGSGLYGASQSGSGQYGGAQYGAGQYGARPGPAPGSITGEVWGPPQAPVRPGRGGTAVGVVIVVVLLVLGGTVAAFFLTRSDDGEQSADPTASASAASSNPSTSASATNADAKVAKVGDCLVNKGSAEKPDMHKAACGANTYQVLKRIDGTADKDKCKGTGNTDWYYFDHGDDTQDFVLCLRQR
jgi:hypothetical protein